MSTTLILNIPKREPEIFDFPIDVYSQNLQRNELTTLVELPRETYRESYGEGHARLTLEGGFGTKTRNINGREETGSQTFVRLEQFFLKYWKSLGSRDPRISNGTTLEYHDWDRDYHYLMGNVDLVIPRSESNKVHLLFTITAILYDRVAPQLFVRPREDALKNVTETSKTLKRFAEKISGFGRRLSSFSDDVRDNVQSVINGVNAITKSLDDVARGATSVALIPLKFSRQVVGLVNNTIEKLGDITSAPVTDLAAELRSIKRAVNKLSRNPEIFKQTVGTATSSLAAAYSDLIEATDTEKERADKEDGSGRVRDSIARSLTEQSYSGVESVDVLQGDTLQSIAARVYGDASRWKQIAIVNGISSSIDLLSLSKVLVPVESLDRESSIPSGSIDTGNTLKNNEERLYGTDLKLSPSNGKYSFSLDRSSANPDIVLVKGLDNLNQAIIKKMLITQGTLLEDPRYGRSQALGSRVADNGAERMKWSMEQSILSDARIDRVSVDISAIENKMTVEASYEPVGLSNDVGTAIAEGI